MIYVYLVIYYMIILPISLHKIMMTGMCFFIKKKEHEIWIVTCITYIKGQQIIYIFKLEMGYPV